MDSILDRYVEQKKEINMLKEKTNNLGYEKQKLEEEICRITSEPYYLKCKKFKNNIKKTIIYKIYSRMRYGKISGNDSNSFEVKKGNEFNYEYMLGANEYRFLKYKKERNQGYRLKINKIGMPYLPGLVSVVLPVYNGEDYVELAIESVLVQTYTNFELIIVDDGSTDNTPQIVDDYEKKDARIKVIHQENRKLPRTLSRGFREARGEFFTWTSADNIMHPQFLEKFVREMKLYPHTAMLYGNIRLIDENGKNIVDYGWYTEDEKNPENVILPRCVLELNTFANNYVGAAFMYRAVVANVVEDYSKYKYGIEDYDYWMKINELFSMRHVSFDDVEYSYRIHAKSLTSKDKELKITENRYKQMLLDDFRRNYYLKHMYWIVETQDSENDCYKKLCDTIHKYGHTIISREEAACQTTNLYERIIYVCFGEPIESEVNEVRTNSFKVLVCNEPYDVNKPIYDAYICNQAVDEANYIGDYRGWYGIECGEDIFAFVDSKAKNRFLYELEGDGAKETAAFVEYSIIISHVNSMQNLKICMESIRCNREYEILVVTNAQNRAEIERLSNESVRVVSCLSDNDAIRKNAAARMADGKILVFIQDDCVFDEEYFDYLNKIFVLDSKIAAVHGTVEVRSNIKYSQYAKILGENIIDHDDIYVYDNQNLPSAYNYAVRNEDYKMVGGFYDLAEGYGAQFCNMSMFGMSMMLQNVGRYVYLSSQSIVTRTVDKIVWDEWKNYVNSEIISNYKLKLDNVIAYDIWPEVLENEIQSLKVSMDEKEDMHLKILADCNAEFLGRVRSDFREKEKVDVHRDIYTQLV